MSTRLAGGGMTVPLFPNGGSVTLLLQCTGAAARQLQGAMNPTTSSSTGATHRSGQAKAPIRVWWLARS
jgi:hypothetical protein